jgi:predicted DNA-binding transcriptional regulator AlpA
MLQDWPDRLRAIEASRYLRVSRSTLSKWRSRGKGPPHHHCGPRLIIYFRSELDEWLTANGSNRGASSHVPEKDDG